MKLFKLLFGTPTKRKTVRKSIKDYQREIISRQGRDQMQKILKLGQMPIQLA